jgi:hypothetical protein
MTGIRTPLRFVISTALAALITAGITVWVNAQSDSRHQQQVVRDNRSKPPLIVSAKYNWSDSEDWVMEGILSTAAEKQFMQITDNRNWSQENIKQLEALFTENQALRLEPVYDFRNNQSKRIGESTPLRLVVTGNRNTPVLIQDMHIRVLARRAPPSGTVFHGPSQGQGDAISLAFNLDSHNPVALRVETEFGLPTPQRYFAKKFVALKLGEPIEFNVYAYTQKCYCEWELVINAVVGKETHEVIVRDRSEPFKTTAHVNSYSSGYSLSSDFSPTHVFTRMPSGWSPLSVNQTVP